MVPLKSTRRHILAVSTTALLGTFAGCSSIIGNTQPKTGNLRIRVRNISDSSHEVTVRVFLNDKDTATFTQSFSLEAPGDAPHTEQFWPNAIEDVADETPYRVVTIVDGIRYEKSDTADCIYDDNEESYEQIHVSIRDDKTKILADNCPA